MSTVDVKMRRYLLELLSGRLIAFYQQGKKWAVTGDDTLENISSLLDAIGRSRSDQEAQLVVGSVCWARFLASDEFEDFNEAIERFRLLDAEHQAAIPARAMKVIREIPFPRPGYRFRGED